MVFRLARSHGAQLSTTSVAQKIHKLYTVLIAFHDHAVVIGPEGMSWVVMAKTMSEGL